MFIFSCVSLSCDLVSAQSLRACEDVTMATATSGELVTPQDQMLAAVPVVVPSRPRKSVSETPTERAPLSNSIRQSARKLSVDVSNDRSSMEMAPTPNAVAQGAPSEAGSTLSGSFCYRQQEKQLSSGDSAPHPSADPKT